ncbi:MAG: transposase [Bacteroidales bacterium]|nr:transposase [Bacteroidales bacterium]
MGNFFNEKLTYFYTAANSVKNHLETVLNFFHNRLTNANAASFNAKIKLFRTNLRGVTDNAFFLFRLHNIFAYPHKIRLSPYSASIINI